MLQNTFAHPSGSCPTEDWFRCTSSSKVRISGNDIVEIFSKVGFRTTAGVSNYLQTYHQHPEPDTSPLAVDVSFLPTAVDIEIASEVSAGGGQAPSQTELSTGKRSTARIECWPKADGLRHGAFCTGAGNRYVA